MLKNIEYLYRGYGCIKRKQVKKFFLQTYVEESAAATAAEPQRRVLLSRQVNITIKLSRNSLFFTLFYRFNEMKEKNRNKEEEEKRERDRAKKTTKT